MNITKLTDNGGKPEYNNIQYPIGWMPPSKRRKKIYSIKNTEYIKQGNKKNEKKKHWT